MQNNLKSLGGKSQVLINTFIINKQPLLISIVFVNNTEDLNFSKNAWSG